MAPALLSTVPAQNPYIQYTATSNQTVFPYPFEITQDSDLVVVLNGVTQSVDAGYSVSGQGNANGGNVTFTTGLTAGTVVTLFRNIIIQRVTQIQQGSGFSSSTFNYEFNQIYLILQDIVASLALCLQVPNTNAPAPLTTLTPASYANKYLSFDANGNPSPAALTVNGTVNSALIQSLLTQAIVGQLLYPQSNAESLQGIVPTNYFYPWLNVLRYGADQTGATDCSTAFTNAGLVAMVYGGDVVIPAPSSYYKFTNPINWSVSSSATYNAGFNVRMQGNNHAVFGSSPQAGTLHAVHTGNAVIDITGATRIKFDNVLITSDNTTFPKCGILTARNSSGASIEGVRLDGVVIFGPFSVANYYNFGSEDDQLVGCFMQQGSTSGVSFAGAQAPKVCVWTANNIASLTSPATIDAATGVSTLHHHVVGGDYAYAGGISATGDIFYSEQAGYIELDHPWVAAASGGRSVIYFDVTNVSSTILGNLTILGLETEAGAAPTNGIMVPAIAATIVGINVFGATWDAVTNVINGGAGVIFSGCKLFGMSSTAGGNTGINISGTLSDSDVSCDTMPLTIGTSKANKLTGRANFWATVANGGSLSTGGITTRIDDYWEDTSLAANRQLSLTLNSWTNASTSGATSKYKYLGDELRFEFTLIHSGTMSATAGTATITGLPTNSFGPGSVIYADSVTKAVLSTGYIDGTGTINLTNNISTANNVEVVGRVRVS